MPQDPIAAAALQEALFAQPSTMAEETAVHGPKGVKDVPAEAFIKAFAAHLKKNDKVRGSGGRGRTAGVSGA